MDDFGHGDNGRTILGLFGGSKSLPGKGAGSVAQTARQMARMWSIFDPPFKPSNQHDTSVFSRVALVRRRDRIKGPIARPTQGYHESRKERQRNRSV